MKIADERGEVAQRYEEGKKSFKTFQKTIFVVSMIVIAIAIVTMLIVPVKKAFERKSPTSGSSPQSSWSPSSPSSPTAAGLMIKPGDPDLTWFGETLRVEIHGEQECSPWITIPPYWQVVVDRVDPSVDDWYLEYQPDNGDKPIRVRVDGKMKEREEKGVAPSRTFRISGQGSFLVFRP